jgi:hypothetical protein
MKLNRKKQNGTGQLKKKDEIWKSEQWGNGAEVTLDGRYRCRDCGVVFDTLKGHYEHHVEVHGEVTENQNRGCISICF